MHTDIISCLIKLNIKAYFLCHKQAVKTVHCISKRPPFFLHELITRTISVIKAREEECNQVDTTACLQIMADAAVFKHCP